MRNQIHKKKDKKKKHQRRRARIEDSDSSDSWMWRRFFIVHFGKLWKKNLKIEVLEN